MKIQWTEPAYQDLDGIDQFIRKDSVFYADRFLDKILGAVESLIIFPGRGRRVPEATKCLVRELLFNHYRIMYRQVGSTILILAIVHGARDLRQKSNKPWELQ